MSRPRIAVPLPYRGGVTLPRIVLSITSDLFTLALAFEALVCGALLFGV